jgi:hypothetical protein
VGHRIFHPHAAPRPAVDHRIFHQDSGQSYTMHIDGCFEIDDGAFSIDFYSQIANRQLVKSETAHGGERPF